MNKKRMTEQNRLTYLELIDVLSHHCGERGESEGAVETLERIIRERDILLKNGIKEKLLKLS
jgi:hypothetical protein